MRAARTAHAQHLFVRVSAGDSFSTKKGKAAVIVSSSFYKKAVDRNLLRRRVYHIIAKHPTILLGLFTVTLKKGALALSSAELEKELLTCLP